MKITRKEKLNEAGWRLLPPIEAARIRSIEQGLLQDRITLSGRVEGFEPEFYRTMIVNSAFIFFNGHTRYIGFVSDDYEEYEYKFHIEEWVVEHRESS